MGIVVKQGFYNTLWMAVGILIGYVNIILLFPIFLTADQFGLTRILWAAGTVFGQFALLGSPQILIKFFTDISKKPKQRGGFFMLMLLISLLGFAVFLLAGTLFHQQIINSYANKSSLFGNYFSYIYVITFFFIYFNILEAYLRALLKTTVAAFLKYTMIRIIWLILILLYMQKIIRFETFIFWFVGAYGIILVILVGYSLALNILKISFRMRFLTSKKIKSMSIFGIYVILGGSTAYLGNYIDVLMVGGMIDLKNVAFYSVAFYLGTVVLLPFNGTANILIPIISESFAKNDLKKIKEIYQNASTNLTLVSILIFLGIWLNVDNIFQLLPPSYAAGKYVMLFIALAKLITAGVGVNVFIIQYSKYFKNLFWFNIAFLIFVVFTNYLFIPTMGIVGAALATFLSQFLVLTMEVIFIYNKMKILPFKMSNLKIIILAGIVFIIVFLIPQQPNIILDIVLRSGIIILIYLPLAYFWKVSEEYNGLINKWLQKIAQIK